MFPNLTSAHLSEPLSGARDPTGQATLPYSSGGFDFDLWSPGQGLPWSRGEVTEARPRVGMRSLEQGLGVRGPGSLKYSQYQHQGDTPNKQGS